MTQNNINVSMLLNNPVVAACDRFIKYGFPLNPKRKAIINDTNATRNI